ncbi:MAG TPA: hypothetical protein VK012_04400 [Gemmatimonadales bacterium]|nr:hypothetical protein [Gemmatimonadales bacterium]
MLALSVLAACTHGEPPTAPVVGLDGPFLPGNPVRLTYAEGTLEPGWTPDGASVFYSYVRNGGNFQRRQERCIGVLPAGGGTLTREICSRTVFPVQVDDAFTSPAISAAGRLALHHRGQPADPPAISNALLVMPFDAPAEYTVARSIPFQGDMFYTTVSSVRWLGESRLAFVGWVTELLPAACPTCDPPSAEYAQAILLVDPDAPGTATLVPGTTSATSVTEGETPDVIYYTLTADSRIHRQVLSTGAVSVAHDFGAPAIVRDVHFVGGRIVAVTDGHTELLMGNSGPVHVRDGGGRLQVVTPGGGPVPVAAPDNMWFRRPALSPDGTAIVAEGTPFSINEIRNSNGEIIAFDTIPGPMSIWKMSAP